MSIYASYKTAPLSTSPFCKKHIKFCPRRSILTGKEPKFNPDKYNRTRHMRESHNCFAFDYVDLLPLHKYNEKSCPVSFPQPGRTSGYIRWSIVKDKRCSDLLARLFGNLLGLKMSSFERNVLIIQVKLD